MTSAASCFHVCLTLGICIPEWLYVWMLCCCCCFFFFLISISLLTFVLWMRVFGFCNLCFVCAYWVLSTAFFNFLLNSFLNVWLVSLLILCSVRLCSLFQFLLTDSFIQVCWMEIHYVKKQLSLCSARLHYNGTFYAWPFVC